MRNLSSRDKFILYCLAVIFIFFGYYELFINPMSIKISETKTAIEEKTVQADEIRTMDSANKKMQKLIAGLSEKYEAYRKLIPTDIRDPEIQKYLHSLAFSEEIQLSSMSFGGAVQIQSTDISNDKSKTDAKGQLMMIPVSLSFSGNFAKIMDFIKTIEKAERISEFQNINISKSSEGAVSVNVVVNYYFINGNEESKQNLDYNFTVPVNGRIDLFE